MEATKPVQPKAQPKAQTSNKKNVKGIKNAFVVILVCFIVAVCLFLFFFGNPGNFDPESFEGVDPNTLATAWGHDKAHPINLIGTIFKGGIIVPVLQTLFLTVIVLSVERYIALSSAKGKGNIAKFVAGVKAALAKNDIAGAQALCSKQKGSVAAVVAAALVRYEEMDKNTVLSKEQKIATLQKEVEEATALEMPALQQNLPIVATMTTLGTLVGLLGTVVGMIKSFQALSNSGAAVIGRTLQAAGYRVAIVPQPNWQDDLRDFKKFGAPRLFFGISPGAMDSMVNHYTANRRRRSDDAYTPDARHGMRPDYPTIVYSGILRKLYPDVPIIAGGIEASLRRLSHYDYWQDRLRPSIIVDAPVDMISYGMGEKTILDIARRLDGGEKISDMTDLRQTVVLRPKNEMPSSTDERNIILSSFEECLADKKKQSANFKHIEQQSNSMSGGLTLWQAVGDKVVKVNPMYPAMTRGEIDASFDLPYTRLPHPRYKGKRIPAYEMIRHSVNLHRGCFGG